MDIKIEIGKRKGNLSGFCDSLFLVIASSLIPLLKYISKPIYSIIQIFININNNNNKMELKCSNCEKQWNYRGKNKVTATCPDCRTLVKIQDESKEP